MSLRVYLPTKLTLSAAPFAMLAAPGIRIEQEASAGTAIANELLILADKLKDGKAGPPQAGAQAAKLIAKGTAQRGG